MDIGTIIGLVLGVLAILIGVVLGGGSIPAMIDPTSVMVVLVGSLGAMVISFPLARILKVHKVILKAIRSVPPDPTETIRELVRYAEVARREGILSLENLIPEMKDPFIVRGVKMAVDGTDPELIKTILDTELEALMERHAQGKAILDALAKYAPAFGMIGTLMGLIFMLKNMDDPSAIGPGMAVALITTLYGALIANVVASPLADKLAARDIEEALVKTIIVTGVMSIQSGDNPRVVEAKLLTFLPPADRDAMQQEKAA
ncbi:MAG: motility protein A [Phycisphaerales bacterium JB039]